MGFDSVNPKDPGSKENGSVPPFDHLQCDDFELDEDEMKELLIVLNSQPVISSRSILNPSLKISSQNVSNSHLTNNSQSILSSQSSQNSYNNGAMDSTLTKTKTFTDSLEFLSDDSIEQELEALSRATSSFCSKSRISSLPTSNTINGDNTGLTRNLSQSEDVKANGYGCEKTKTDKSTFPTYGNLKRLNSSIIGSSPVKKFDSKSSPNLKKSLGIQASNNTVSKNHSSAAKKMLANPLDELSEDSDLDDISLENLFVNQPPHPIKSGSNSTAPLINPATSKSNQTFLGNGPLSNPQSSSTSAAKRDRGSFLGTSISYQTSVENRMYSSHNVKMESRVPSFPATSITNPNQKQTHFPQARAQRWNPKSFGSIFLKPHSKNIKTQPRITSRRLNFSDQLWTESLAPNEMKDVVVHHNKVRDVRNWLEGASRQCSKAKLLVLSGPPGSGRSSLIKALAKDMQMRLVEWITPDSPPQQSEDYTEGLSEQFRKFIQTGTRFKALGFNTENGGQLVLLDDLPSIEHTPTRAKIQATLCNICRDPRTRFPIVLIATCLGSATDDDSDQLERPSYLFSSQSLVPSFLFDQHLAFRINFNPVAVTLIRKALVRALELRYDITVPSKSNALMIVKEISEGAQGDLRSAINELQLRCAGRTFQQLGFTEQTTSPEIPLSLFHAIGKVFFCKWEAGVMKTKPESYLMACPVELPQFCEFLFQNYPPFLLTIDQSFMAADAFSCASALTIPWGQDPYPQATSLMRAMLLTRGLLAAIKCNPHSSSRPRFTRPFAWSFIRQMNCNKETISSVSRKNIETCGMFRPTTSQMVTDFLPYLSLMRRTSPEIEALVRFSKPKALNITELHDGDDISADLSSHDILSSLQDL